MTNDAKEDAMTKWEKGDRFKLAAEGTITWPKGSYIGVEFDEPRLAEPEAAEMGRAWFDEHATKIEPPLEFGQRVKRFGDDPNVYRVLEYSRVEGGAGSGDDLVLLWPEGADHVTSFQRSELVPVE